MLTAILAAKLHEKDELVAIHLSSDKIKAFFQTCNGVFLRFKSDYFGNEEEFLWRSELSWAKMKFWCSCICTVTTYKKKEIYLDHLKINMRNDKGSKARIYEILV